ncbi:MAG: hypothetical protein AAB403_03155, partial [Planctomycetota bacterium]
EPPLSPTHWLDSKNVPGPIRSALDSLGTLQTGKMFLDLSGIHVSSRSHSVNLKNVPGATPELAPILAAFSRITLLETATVSACCVFCQSCRKYAPGR